jgi:hypothetical protein
MAETYSDDGCATIKQISFDPLNGFTWTAVDNITKNEAETFSDHDLYLQGFNATFPDMYEVDDTPIYNPDQTGVRPQRGPQDQGVRPTSKTGRGLD